MERIINFNAGIKTNVSSKHTTMPVSQITNGNLSSLEENPNNDSDLSPIYKKKSHFSDNKSNLESKKFKKEEIINSKLEGKINFSDKYATDESEPNSPEDFKKKTLKDLSSNNPKFKPIQTNQINNQIKEVKEEDNEIKQISLFNEANEKLEKERPSQKKSFTINIKNNKNTINVLKNSDKNDSAAISEGEVNKIEIYKAKESTINNHPFRHLIFSDSVTESCFKRHLMLTYRGLVYAKKCLKGPSDKFIKTKQVTFKEQKELKKKTLFLDLDETLVHACQLKENPEHVVLVPSDNGSKISVGINIRPYCLEFLEKVSFQYEVYIFTASSASYSKEIINFIDSTGKYIKGILSRESCMETKIGFFIKDLRIIKNRDLKDIVIVDNLAHSFGFQIENGIPILEFNNNKQDLELKYLAEYLSLAAEYDDLREFNKKQLKLHELSEMKIEDLEI